MQAVALRHVHLAFIFNNKLFLLAKQIYVPGCGNTARRHFTRRAAACSRQLPTAGRPVRSRDMMEFCGSRATDPVAFMAMDVFAKTP
jgi:hypothetical protein